MSVDQLPSAAPAVIIKRLTSVDCPEVQQGAHLVAHTFGTDFGSKFFPNGITPAIVQFRREQIQRYIKLDALGKPFRAYVAKREKDGDLLAIACTAISSKDDPEDEWESLARKAQPPVGDTGPSWRSALQEGFGKAKKRAISQTGDETYQELVYLVVTEAARRTGAGTALLRQVFADVGDDMRTFLVTAPTISAEPFYLKHEHAKPVKKMKRNRARSNQGSVVKLDPFRSSDASPRCPSASFSSVFDDIHETTGTDCSSASIPSSYASHAEGAIEVGTPQLQFRNRTCSSTSSVRRRPLRLASKATVPATDAPRSRSPSLSYRKQPSWQLDSKMALDRKALADAPTNATPSHCSSSSIYTHTTASRSAVPSSSSYEAQQHAFPRRPSTQGMRPLNRSEAPMGPALGEEEEAVRADEPDANRFDSLQDLLEQAGYKDTRIVTPQPKRLVDITKSKRDSNGTLDSNESPIVTTRRLGGSAQPDQYKGSSMASGLAQQYDDGRAASVGPLVSAEGNSQRERAPSASSSWFSGFWKAGNSVTSAPPASVAKLENTAPSSDVDNTPRGKTAAVASSPPKFERSLSSPPRTQGRRNLATKSSTISLWKGSRSYKSAATANPNLSSSSPPRLASKASLGHLRGGGHAASVGVGISACDGGAAALSSLRNSASRTSSRSGSGSANDAAPEVDTIDLGFARMGVKSAAIEEWRRSLVAVKGPTDLAVSFDNEASDDVDSPPRLRLKSAAPAPVVVSKDLFASVAGPVVSSEAAVAPRNSECFKGPEARGLRHAKSVEALRSALNQKKKPAIKTRHSTIGQRAPKASEQQVPPVPALPSFPSDGSIASLLRDQRATTTYRDVLPGEAEVEPQESPERPRGPPVLTVTSPSGVHSPQVVKLEGKEFEARTFSPPASIEGRMLISEGFLPDQLRNFDALISAVSGRGRSRGRVPRRKDGTESSRDGSSVSAESDVSEDGAADEVAQPRRTRRGRRAGRKHGRSIKNLAAAAAADAASDNVSSRSTEQSAVPEHNFDVESVTKERSSSTAPSAEASTVSFGSASQNLVKNRAQADDEEEDPFIAHVKAQEEAKRSSVVSILEKKGSCRSASPHQGIASILGSDTSCDNDENVSPNSSGARPSTPRSCKGRIVGRSRPNSMVSNDSREPPRVSIDPQARARIIASAIPPRAMSSPSEAMHSRNGSWDSPTKEVAQRIKKMRSRRF
ncbi:hypothetical protein BCV69DRAFT_291962 [Microstroma glucosiphilum]|uniref:Uncharacterized protein n=1 Tax=Pseudomicrostroma glucosiphilum TaxID=1684307 RepID=A0A316UJE7_9BASI|nr:hypothetical protein BCV69DRAFT_291962 [Pseudomicrostroma glucosiphilum]PWN24073.1 hypothetical protein BCV69DRAFT_291962 [Pseudomicrostroma glucosiphilum]